MTAAEMCDHFFNLDPIQRAAFVGVLANRATVSRKVADAFAEALQVAEKWWGHTNTDPDSQEDAGGA